MYYSIIYPYLQYCVIVWGLTYPTNIRRIELLQKRVIRILNKSAFDAHTSPIFKKLGLLKLNDICMLQLGQFMFHHKFSLLPERFDNMFLKNDQTHTFNTRNSSKYHVPSCSIMYLHVGQISDNFRCAFKVQNFLTLFLMIWLTLYPLFYLRKN